MTTPHDYFGCMELDERRRWYRAVLDFSPSHKVSVIIDWIGIAPAEALKRSQIVCERIRAREPEYRDRITRDKLRLYNDDWRDGEAMDADGFKRQILLSGITISPVEFGSDSCASLCYSCGNLFAGHEIGVTLDVDFNYVRSCLEG